MPDTPNPTPQYQAPPNPWSQPPYGYAPWGAPPAPPAAPKFDLDTEVSVGGKKYTISELVAARTAQDELATVKKQLDETLLGIRTMLGGQVTDEATAAQVRTALQHAGWSADEANAMVQELATDGQAPPTPHQQPPTGQGQPQQRPSGAQPGNDPTQLLLRQFIQRDLESAVKSALHGNKGIAALLKQTEEKRGVEGRKALEDHLIATQTANATRAFQNQVKQVGTQAAMQDVFRHMQIAVDEGLKSTLGEVQTFMGSLDEIGKNPLADSNFLGYDLKTGPVGRPEFKREPGMPAPSEDRVNAELAKHNADVLIRAAAQASGVGALGDVE